MKSVHRNKSIKLLLNKKEITWKAIGKKVQGSIASCKLRDYPEGRGVH